MLPSLSRVIISATNARLGTWLLAKRYQGSYPKLLSSVNFQGATPTDPDVTDLVIRFLDNQSISTTLTHNFTALQAL